MVERLTKFESLQSLLSGWLPLVEKLCYTTSPMNNADGREGATVNMFWHGERLPPLVWACMRSFVEKGHHLRVFSYGAPALPDGVEPADAREISETGPQADYRAIGAFSDLFRYKLLYRCGGWWVDTDVYCVARELPLASYAWAEQEPGIVNGAILKFPARDPLCGEMLQRAIERSRRPVEWGAIGPDLLTAFLAKRRNPVPWGTTDSFYPWNWREAALAWFPETKAAAVLRMKNAAFVHLWFYSLRQMGIDLARDPPPGSLWADMIRDCPNRLPGDERYRQDVARGVRRFLRDYCRAPERRRLMTLYPELFRAAGARSTPAEFLALASERLRMGLGLRGAGRS